MNRLLMEFLRESGFQVDVFAPKQNLLFRIFRYMFGTAIAMALPLNRYLQRRPVNILFVDGAASFFYGPYSALNLIHFDYLQYRTSVQKLGFLENVISLRNEANQEIAFASNKNVTVSVDLQKFLKDTRGIFSHCIPNCVDTQTFIPLRNREIRYRLGYLGGYSYYGKGFDLMESLSKILGEIHCFTDIDPKISGLVFHPYVKPEEVPRIFSQMKILLYLSRSETFGLVPLEAMACGIPVIMYEVGFGTILKEEFPAFVLPKDIPTGDILNQIVKRIEWIEEHYDSLLQTMREFVFKNGFDIGSYKKNWKEYLKEENFQTAEANGNR